MAANILRLSEHGRRLFEKRRTCNRASHYAGNDAAERRRLYVDDKQLRRARSSYVEGHDALRSDVLLESRRY
jgi:hypothetical protein